MRTDELLKALGNDTRLTLVQLLLRHNYCVRALAEEMDLAESTVSEHLKVLREAGLLRGEQRGHYMHYTVCRMTLKELAAELGHLAETQYEECPGSVQESCEAEEPGTCKKAGTCDDLTQEMCHGE